MNIEKIAQELIDAISPVVSERTINIMDNNAIIIASSDPTRIGTYHQGAAEAIATGKTVRIFKEDLHRYKGAREGINAPILMGDKIAGIVGIYGNPDEVVDAANLLCIYVQQYFAHIALTKKEHLRSELQNRLLKLIIYGAEQNSEEIFSICSILNLQLFFPMCSIIVALEDDKINTMSKLKKLDELTGYFSGTNVINASHDIYGISDDCFVLLKWMPQSISSELMLEQIYEAVLSKHMSSPAIAMGGLCEHLAQIPASYREVLAHVKAQGSGVYYMDNNETKLKYMLYKLEEMDNARFISAVYQRLINHFGQQNMEWVMETIQAYIDYDGSINKASSALHIHKNTLSYRMNKILEIAKLKNEKHFTRECFLQMLLIHYKKMKKHI